MAELKLPRLLAAAKEFNIGQDTLIDFLVGKGFPKDDLKPTSKLTEDMYRSLQQEFQSDKAAKMKSDQLELPKNAPGEVRKKKEEEEISFKSAKPSRKKEEPAPAKEEKEEKVEKAEEIVKAEAPVVEGPKVVTKIDLDAIDSSVRPKKGTKAKKEEKVEQEVKPAEKKKKTEVKAEVAPPVKEEPAKPTEEAPPVIENIEVEKLSGPKILGKIDLPVNNDTRPVREEKRPRKRIPLTKNDNVQRQVFVNKDQDNRGGGGGFNRGRGGQQQRPPQQRGGARREEKLIDEKEIQRKIQETQAKLTGGAGKGKSVKAKLRREKKQEMAEAMGEEITDCP